jgi:hypothetical protein
MILQKLRYISASRKYVMQSFEGGQLGDFLRNILAD